jgi:DNA-binding response OmpR family regulator
MLVGGISGMARSQKGCGECSPRVLVAEDSSLIAMDLEKILQENGCEVVGPVSSAEDGIAALLSGPIDAAILDYLLADGTVEPLAKVLDERGIAYVLCTGAQERGLSHRYPPAPVLTKPYRVDDVCAAVKELLGQHPSNLRKLGGTS